jgi:hypothetical protein
MRGGRRPRPAGRPAAGGALAAAPLLADAARLWVRALPVIVGVTLVGPLPLQLALSWILVRQGIWDQPLWRLQYQGIADWVVGSLLVAALYIAIADVAAGAERGGRCVGVGGAYRRALRAWLGMFLTRMMVSVVVGVAALPALLGLWLAGRLSPGLAAALRDPASLADLGPAGLAPLAIVVPFLVPAALVYLRYALVEPVVALERVDGFEALERSAGLTAGVRLPLARSLLPLVAALEVVGLAVSAAGDALGPWASALATAASGLVFCLAGCLLVVVHRARAAATGPAAGPGAGSPAGPARAAAQ